MERKRDENGMPILSEIEELYYRKLTELQVESIEDEEFFERKRELHKCTEKLEKLLSKEGKKAYLEYDEAESKVEAYLEFYNFVKGMEYQKKIMENDKGE